MTLQLTEMTGKSRIASPRLRRGIVVVIIICAPGTKADGNRDYRTPLWQFSGWRDISRLNRATKNTTRSAALS
jgi:hypothetical protein